MTNRRLAIASNSSRSLEMRSTAPPSAANSSRVRCTSAVAERSSPRVTLCATMTRGFCVSARHLEPLTIPARERRRERVWAGGAHAKRVQRLAAKVHRALNVEPSAARHPRANRFGQQEIFPETHVEDEPIEVAILRDNRHRRTVGTSVNANRSRRCAARTGQDLDQFNLAVAIDARDARNLAGIQAH